MSYRPNALKHRLINFFVDNPDEELTVEDICVKFDCTEPQVRVTISKINESSEIKLDIVRHIRLAQKAD